HGVCGRPRFSNALQFAQPVRHARGGPAFQIFEVDQHAAKLSYAAEECRGKVIISWSLWEIGCCGFKRGAKRSSPGQVRLDIGVTARTFTVGINNVEGRVDYLLAKFLYKAGFPHAGGTFNQPYLRLTREHTIPRFLERGPLLMPAFAYEWCLRSR